MWKAWVCPYWPFRWLCNPEMMTERLAEQEAVVAKAWVKRVPRRARRSSVGVWMIGFGAEPSREGP